MAQTMQPVTQIDPEQVRARLQRRLCLYFAAVTCLGTLTLAGNPATQSLAVTGCFFAIFGLIFVDLLRWFALPSAAAYLALGAIALYSIGQIGQLVEHGLGIAGDQQMIVVAQLLVWVQAVLMLQRKNRRIYEQLAIFCLLELIVAAIFNDAISYGVLLLPLGVVGAGALGLLQAYQAAEEAFTEPGEGRAAGMAQGAGTMPAAAAVTGGSRVGSRWSATSFHRAGLVLPRLALTVLTPAVLLVALLFFYALPRTHLSAGGPGGGKVLVGFSDTVRLGQIGRMLQSDELALRIDLTARSTRQPYHAVGGLYLRGAVLESYRRDTQEDGTWATIPTRQRPRRLPPTRLASSPRTEADELVARITVEPTNSRALFAMPPYQRYATGSEVTHQHDRWLLSRRRGFQLINSNQLTYQFATTGFQDSRQSRFVPRFAPLPPPPKPPGDRAGDHEGVHASDHRGDPTGDHAVDRADDVDWQSGSGPSEYEQMVLQDQQDRLAASHYEQICLEYDEDRVPAAAQLARTVLGSAVTTANPLEVAMQLERHLSTSDRYRYTLDLTATTVPGMDPIEQFLTIDRRGNCQHFASALVFMLRSQGIPARLVVGYHTDEFNAIGGFYVARQLHAHAWVEALIEARWIGPDRLSEAAAAEDQYWVRLDPTPGGGGVDRETGGHVADALGLAQSMWSDYVIKRNASSRHGDSLASGGAEAITSQYQLVFLWLDFKLSQIRDGRLGGGSLSLTQHFSWTAAVLGVMATLLVVLGLHLRWPAWWRGGNGAAAAAGKVAVPQVPFYAETLGLLQRVGLGRARGQTPLELTTQAAASLELEGAAPLDRPLRLLTDAFYDTRFSGAAGSDLSSNEPTDPEVRAALRSVRERVALIEARSRLPAHS